MTVLVLVPSARERAGLEDAADLSHLVVATCGVGLVAAALATAARLEADRPDHVVLAGVAGARRPLEPGSLVVGTDVLNEAVGVGRASDFRGLEAMGLGPPDGPPDRLPLAPLPGPPWPEAVPAGTIGTVATSAADAAQAAERSRRHPDVLVEEMEGHAVAAACHGAGVPCSILRAVSNVAGDRDVASWALGPALAALGRRLQRIEEPSPT